MEDNNIYGADGQVKISFGRGTVHQAYEDRTVGGVNFGYDAENDFGVTYIEGKLYSSRVLNLTISGAEDAEKTILVKYVNADGFVAEKSFKTTDAALVQQMIDAAAPEEKTYTEGDYIGIVADPENDKNFIVSVKYDELIAKVREDLLGDIDVSALKDEVDAIEHSYVKDVQQADVNLNDDVDTFTVRISKEGTESDVDINVPKADFYEGLREDKAAVDAAISDLDDRKADKGDVCTIWKDVHELLEDARNSE